MFSVSPSQSCSLVALEHHHLRLTVMENSVVPSHLLKRVVFFLCLWLKSSLHLRDDPSEPLQASD